MKNKPASSSFRTVAIASARRPSSPRRMTDYESCEDLFRRWMSNQPSPRGPSYQQNTIDDYCKALREWLKDPRFVSIEPKNVFLVLSKEEFDDFVNTLKSLPVFAAFDSDNQNGPGRLSAALNLYGEFLDQMDPVLIRIWLQKESRQRIFYGAPGTGKSFQTDKVAKEFDDTIRVTFHPDSDYASFVGCYKPTMEKDPFQTIVTAGKTNSAGQIVKNDILVTQSRIVYEFVPQAFTKAYELAWRKMAECKEGEHPAPQFLVIEEINRGNCAQIFGDLFQLLDRDDETGYSSYPVDPDADLAKHLHDWFRAKSKDGKGVEHPAVVTDADGDKWDKIKVGADDSDTDATWDDVLSGRKLVLPPNLYIWATMNTSDQSLFPIDSAFKRRWDWKYVPITEHKEEDYKIEIDGATYDWWTFVKKINERIFEATESEDKKLGYFFVKAEKKGGRNVIDAERFLNKVVFYLWNDVFKSSEPEKAFRFKKPGEDKESDNTFQSFFDDVSDADKDKHKNAMLKAFLAGLGVEPVKPKSDESTSDDAAAAETGRGDSLSGAAAPAPADAPTAPEADATETDGTDAADA